MREAIDPAVRRIIAVEAHRRRTGRCPTLVHALGTGESFAIVPEPDGFTDLHSGLRVRADGARLMVPGQAAVEIALDDDITFSGFEPASGVAFSGRAGGGASITVYAGLVDYFQYAVGVQA